MEDHRKAYQLSQAGDNTNLISDILCGSLKESYKNSLRTFIRHKTVDFRNLDHIG